MEWFRPDPVVPVEGEKVALSFAINDYPGSANDLNFCINDQVLLNEKLKSWNFKFKNFRDSEVTKQTFKEQIKSQVALLKPGDLIVTLMDCCFSEDNTKSLALSRCYIPEKPFTFNSKALKSMPLTWVALSACQDYQTALDNAFTPCAMATLTPGITYKEWYLRIADMLDKKGFEQIPAIQGPEELLNKKVFEGNVLVIHYSGHGTPATDPDNDEEDNQAEAIYVYDGMVLDDEINTILSNNFL